MSENFEDTEEFINLLQLKCMRDMDKESKSLKIEFNEALQTFLKKNPEISRNKVFSAIFCRETFYIFYRK